MLIPCDDTEEMLVELNDNGIPTGQPVKRKTAHRLGVCHHAVSLFVYNCNNEILLQKRSLNKQNNPGLWDISVSGHSLFGEDILKTLIREAEEEANLIIDASDMQFLLRYRENKKVNDNFFENSFFDVYIIQIKHKPNFSENSEVEELRFFKLNEIKKMMHDYKELSYKPQAFEALIKYFEKQ